MKYYTYLIKIGFNRTSYDNFYLKDKGQNVLIVEVFLDDIIFGWGDELCMSFFDEIKKKFEMSTTGEIKFFIWL